MHFELLYIIRTKINTNASKRLGQRIVLFTILELGVDSTVH